MTEDQVSGVVYAVEAGVATITMTTPALGRESKRALLTAVSAAGSDPEVRAVVLTGSGRAFCVGQDLREHAEALRAAPAEAFATLAEHYNPTVLALSSMPKPVLALINGRCAGAGLGLALACDLRIAAAGVRMATAFTGIGLTPDSGLSASLSRSVGVARASELILRGEHFTAEDALAWGLVGSVVPAAELAEAGRQLATRLAAGSTAAYATAKRAIRSAWAASLEDVLSTEERDQSLLGATPEHQQAVEAFLVPRRPESGGQGQA